MLQSGTSVIRQQGDKTVADMKTITIGGKTYFVDAQKKIFEDKNLNGVFDSATDTVVTGANSVFIKMDGKDGKLHEFLALNFGARGYDSADAVVALGTAPTSGTSYTQNNNVADDFNQLMGERNKPLSTIAVWDDFATTEEKDSVFLSFDRLLTGLDSWITKAGGENDAKAKPAVEQRKSLARAKELYTWVQNPDNGMDENQRADLRGKVLAQLKIAEQQTLPAETTAGLPTAYTTALSMAKQEIDGVTITALQDPAGATAEQKDRVFAKFAEVDRNTTLNDGQKGKLTNLTNRYRQLVGSKRGDGSSYLRAEDQQRIYTALQAMNPVDEQLANIEATLKQPTIDRGYDRLESWVEAQQKDVAAKLAVIKARPVGEKPPAGEPTREQLEKSTKQLDDLAGLLTDARGEKESRLTGRQLDLLLYALDPKKALELDPTNKGLESELDAGLKSEFALGITGSDKTQIVINELRLGKLEGELKELIDEHGFQEEDKKTLQAMLDGLKEKAKEKGLSTEDVDKLSDSIHALHQGVKEYEQRTGNKEQTGKPTDKLLTDPKGPFKNQVDKVQAAIKSPNIATRAVDTMSKGLAVIPDAISKMMTAPPAGVWFVVAIFLAFKTGEDMDYLETILRAPQLVRERADQFSNAAKVIKEGWSAVQPRSPGFPS